MRKFVLSIWLIATLLLAPVDFESQAHQNTAPFLLKDLNTHTSEGSEDFYMLFSGPVSYFYFNEGLWRTDGTPTGTAFVKAVSTIYPEGSQGIMFGGLLFFGAKYSSTSRGQGFELWKSDGTADGTVLVADLVAGPAGIHPDSFQLMDDKLYFRANYSLWRLDTPNAQPVRLAGPDYPENPVSIEGSLWMLDSRLYFSGADAVYGKGLWVSDGTSAGTTILFDPWPGDGSSYAEPLLVTTDALYFVSNNGPSGWEMWRYRPTLGSISVISDVNAIHNSGIQHPLPMGNAVFFTACQQDFDDCHLFRTEGDITRPLFDQHPELAPAMPIPLGAIQTEAGERFLFFGASSNNRYDLWATDGSEAGTEILYASQRQFYGKFGPRIGVRPQSAFYDGRLYFSVSDPQTGVEIWQSDGTRGGTHLFKDIWPGLRSSHPEFLGNCGIRFCFKAHDGEHGMEIWSTDGTPEHTQLTVDLNLSPSSSNPRDLVHFNGQIYFTADDWEHGAGLWKTDGTSEGTQPVWSSPTNPDTAPNYLTVANNRLFFVQNDLIHGPELWVTEGTAESTHLVADIIPGLGGSDPRNLMVSGNYLFFKAMDPDPGMSLWRTDGTDTGTVKLKQLAQSYNDGMWDILTPYQDTVVFPYQTQNGTELWKTDGTLAGTKWFATVDHFKEKMVEGNGKLFFTAFSDPTGIGRPWQSNGTTAGTHPIPAPNCLGENHFQIPPVSIGNAVIWITPGENQYNVLKTSGDGLHCVATIPFENGSPYIQTISIPPSYGKALFSLYVISSGWRTWVTDGTEQGSYYMPGPPIWNDHGFPVGPLLLYNAYSKGTGVELWLWDGTKTAANLVADIAPGSSSSSPDNYFAWNHRLYFSASDGSEPGVSHGTELWVYDVPLQSVWLPLVSH